MTNQHLQPRPPIVVVLGHIDHGKTKLLDAIRKTNVAAKESGGITQHIGAYEVQHSSASSEQVKKITFIDTPGHEAFRKMRIRGASVADVAVLVVAADDGVKPQTLEALEAILEAKIPYVVALNKIDKKEADLEHAKKQLADNNVLIEEWGGKIPLVAVSAKEEQNLDLLLETIILLAELEELRADPRQEASGVVIESHLDPKRGNAATLLIRDGTLEKGDYVVAKDTISRVKILEDFQGVLIDSATFSMPVRVVGFDLLPQVGAPFSSHKTKEAAEEALESNAELSVISPSTPLSINETEGLIIPILLKADTAGSLEALEDELKKIIFKGAVIKFLGGGAGDVGESDVKMVAGKKGLLCAIITGFRVKILEGASVLAERLGVSASSFDIIYEAKEWVEKTVKSLIPKRRVRVDRGELGVLKLFKEEGNKRIIGCRLKSGIVALGFMFDISRRGRVIGGGRVANVEQNKMKVREITSPSECGLLVETKQTLERGDTLLIFEEKEDDQ